MAVAEMSKLNLVAMGYDRDAVLNALHMTGATEIKLHSETADTVILECDGGELSEKLARYESALEILSAAADGYFKQNKIKSDVLKDGFSVTYTQFMNANKLGEGAAFCVEKVFALSDKERELNAELSRLKKSEQSARAYASLEEPLSAFSDTAYTHVKLGTVPAASCELLKEGDEPFASEVLNISGDTALIMFAAHKSFEGASEILQNASFTPCPFDDGRTGKEIYEEITANIAATEEEIEKTHKELCALNTEVKKLKIYCDYLRFELEKLQLADKMRATEVTVLMEAYVPKEAEGTVAAAIEGASGAVYYEFSEPEKDEIPPTLYKNNKVVKNFETITNMYSPVNSREFDPNTVMAFFYSLFLGFIMGDIGYGLIMLAGGGFIYFRQKRDTGLKRLAGVFAAGGVFALIWGVLFNSLFGISLPMPTVIPDAQKDMWSLAGIKVPAVLIISLIIGVVQLFAGYICNAIQSWRRGNLIDGIFDGIIWAIFSVGVGLAIVGFVEELNMSSLALIGGCIAGVSLVIAMLTAGRKEKLLGKFTKGFGAAYGVINYASDILSYARLYGLMLSGAVIAQIVSTYAIDFIMGGNVALIVLGVLLMVVGHGFNLAIGLLGAYIHDARLQYVEFYGRFYEGEGELFAPLGSNQKYIYLEATPVYVDNKQA